MVDVNDEAAFEAYVRQRGAELSRTAALLVGDAHDRRDDLDRGQHVHATPARLAAIGTASRPSPCPTPLVAPRWRAGSAADPVATPGPRRCESVEVAGPTALRPRLALTVR